MRWIRGILWIVASISMVAMLGSFIAEPQYQGRAKLVQRIHQDPGAALFDEVGTPIGSPQMMIIEDPKAFLNQKDASGAELVSENYLTKNKIYPLQLQTVSFVIRSVRLVAFGAFAVAAVGLWWLTRHQAKP